MDAKLELAALQQKVDLLLRMGGAGRNVGGGGGVDAQQLLERCVTLERETEARETENAALRAEVASLREKMVIIARDVKPLAAERQELKRSVAELEAAGKDARGRCFVLRVQLAQRNAARERQTECARQLREDLAAALEEVETLKPQLHALQDQDTRLRGEATAATEQRVQLEARLAEWETANVQLEKINTEQAELLATLRQELEVATQHGRDLATQHKVEMDRSVAQTKDLLDHERAETAKAQEAFEESVAAQNALREEHTAAMERARELHDNEMEALSATHTEERKRLQEEVQAVQLQLTEKQEFCEQLVSICKRKIKEEKDANAEAREELEKTRKVAHQAQRRLVEIARLTKQNEELESRVTRLTTLLQKRMALKDRTNSHTSTSARSGGEKKVHGNSRGKNKDKGALSATDLDMLLSSPAAPSAPPTTAAAGVEVTGGRQSTSPATAEFATLLNAASQAVSAAVVPQRSSTASATASSSTSSSSRSHSRKNHRRRAAPRGGGDENDPSVAEMVNMLESDERGSHPATKRGGGKRASASSSSSSSSPFSTLESDGTLLHAANERLREARRSLDRHDVAAVVGSERSKSRKRGGTAGIPVQSKIASAWR